MAATHREAIQKTIQQDWANREYIEVITGSIKKITDFLNSFGKYFYHHYSDIPDNLSFLFSNYPLNLFCLPQICHADQGSLF